MTTKVNDWAEKKPWITDEETKDMLEKVEEFLKWFNDLEEQQSALALHADPVLTTSEVNKKTKNLKKLFDKINGKKKPAPPKKEKKEEEEKTQEKADEKSEQKENEEPTNSAEQEVPSGE